MPVSKLPTVEYYLESEFDGDVTDGYINGVYYIDAETAGGKEQAYIYDEQSASAYKIEPTIIWGVEMHGYEYGNLLATEKGLINKVKESKESSMEGEGTEESPYQIKNILQLQNVKNDLTASYILMADLDLSTIESWTPLGVDSNNPFTGTFEGNGHTISNMKIISEGDLGENIGLFGYVKKGTISNLVLENYEITGANGDKIGGLAGYNTGGTITNIRAIGNIILTGETESSHIGGLVGSALNGASVSKCYTEGNVQASTGRYIGGIAGYTNNNIPIENSYSTVNVTGDSYVGGLIGGSYCKITNSYAMGKVTGNSFTSGLIGYLSGTVKNSYWVFETTEQLTGGGGIGKVLADLLKKETYSGWDFEDIWAIDEGNSTAYLQGMEVPTIIYDIVAKVPKLEGAGTSSNPYIIKTVYELHNVRNNMTAYYKLGANIDLAEIENWIPIGTEDVPFAGNFDGDGYAISNMKITSSGDFGENIGLFGYTDETSVIQNLNLDNYAITGGYGDNIGGLVGYNLGNITKVKTKGEIKLTGSTISKNIGGLVGYAKNSDSRITKCYTEGKITISKGNYVGGLIGNCVGPAVNNSYSSMNITANSTIGGLIGSATSDAMIVNTYAIGSVAGNESVGGLVGATASTAECKNSYWSKEASGQTKSAMGMHREIAALTQKVTYSSWDFTDTWAIDEDKSLAYLQGMEVPSIVYDYVKDYPVMEGTGTSSNPFIITNAEQLDKVRYGVSTSYYKLGANIDLSVIENWTPIGTKDAPFAGNFDGNGYAISNMKISVAGGENIGLFGYTDETSVIQNLNLDNYTITGSYGNHIGGLVGYNQGNITKVKAKGEIKLTGSTASTDVGGLVGYAKNSDSRIIKCYTEGNITASKTNHVGGLIGWCTGPAVSNSYSSMNITANNTVGGLIGTAASDTMIVDTYAIGSITGNNNVGGLVGTTDSSVECETSYWSKEASGQITSSSGTAKDLTALTRKTTYSGWDFTNTWAIDEKTSLAYLQGMEVPSIVYDCVKDYPVMEGTGTSTNPFIITNAEQLDKVRYGGLSTSYYKLGANIDLTSIEKWTPIGTEDAPFAGNFDGDGYTISNMKITTTGDLGDYIGLFGYTDETSVIQNLNLDNYTITGSYGDHIGGLVGYNLGNITKVKTKGEIKLTGSTRSNYIGGLVGTADNSDSKITKCYTEGNIQASTGWCVGGLIGYCGGPVVSNSYSSMDITASTRVGGLIGQAASDTMIIDTYAIGKVPGSSVTVGGLVGTTGSSVVCETSYWSRETSGQTKSNLGTEKEISALTQKETYSGWDFEDTWAIDEKTSLAYLQGMEVPSIVYDYVKDYPVMEGTGTSTNPFIITNAEQLDKARYGISTSYYKLGANIDLSSIEKWTPIGTEDEPFAGNFDGGGYTISNMKITTTGDLGENIGLFGYTDTTSVIQNLNLDNYTITGGYGDNIGGLVGYNQGKITKVKTKGEIKLTASTTSNYIGGLVGYVNSGSTISTCYTEGNITSSKGNYVGGLIGYTAGVSSTNVSVTNSYSNMNVNANKYIGGLIGYTKYTNISYTYAMGKVTGSSNVGGLVGNNVSGSAKNSYYDTTTTGQSASDLGTGLATSDMLISTTFIDAGWSTEVWNLVDGQYPTLL